MDALAPGCALVGNLRALAVALLEAPHDPLATLAQLLGDHAVPRPARASRCRPRAGSPSPSLSLPGGASARRTRRGPGRRRPPHALRARGRRARASKERHDLTFRTSSTRSAFTCLRSFSSRSCSSCSASLASCPYVRTRARDHSRIRASRFAVPRRSARTASWLSDEPTERRVRLGPLQFHKPRRQVFDSIDRGAVGQHDGALVRGVEPGAQRILFTSGSPVDFDSPRNVAPASDGEPEPER